MRERRRKRSEEREERKIEGKKEMRVRRRKMKEMKGREKKNKGRKKGKKKKKKYDYIICEANTRHTGVVAYGNEFYFGGGIQCDPAGMTPYGTPIRVVDLGVTHVPKEVFEEYLHEISPRYTAETYNLLSHNCNNFSNEVVQFLVGTSIPDYILKLPNEVMGSPMGALILPMIQRLETTLRSGAVPQAPQFTTPPVARPSVPKNIASSPSKDESLVQSDGHKADSGSSPSKVPEVSPSQKAAPVSEKKSPGSDPLGDARSRVQEEITKEFMAIMATGTLRASEAAALAARRVMERHGLFNVPMQQG